MNDTDTTDVSPMTPQIELPNIPEMSDLRIHTEREEETAFIQSDPPPSLNTIPLELESILGEDEGYIFEDEKYDLHPAVLQVCQQNYEEGCDILYAQQFIVCFNTYLIKDCYPRSPLFRRNIRFQHSRCHEYNTSFKNVRRWKIIVSSYNNIGWIETPSWGLNAFEYFCDRLSSVAITGLEIILCDPNSESKRRPIKPREILRPLTILRNRFNYSTSDSSEVSQRKSNMPKPRMYKKLKHLVEGNRPVERLSEMHSRLVRFTRSFENFAPWKLEMAADAEEVDPSLSNPRHFNHWPSPYTGVTHTSFLEKTLREAYTASQYFDSAKFKSLRAGIVHHLHPQYDRILNASRLLVEAIKERKIKFEALDPVSANIRVTRRHDWEEIAELAVLVEEEISTHEKKARKLQVDYPRAMMLQRLGRILEDKRSDLFFAAFQDLLHDLEGQFLEIRQAWEDLFKGDTHQKTMCDILYDSRCLEGVIDLTVREPDMRVPRKEYAEWGAGSSWG
ncbi:hypothetical protein SBOR_5255 [Sclerotinia borealis F-4128]|uniref:Uncharacterized protein n=1 Tax=Sclerotinia borealis (strain F-4128) TaxID=1432307 RepID=W9CEW1_SCLBF|nr:hypothetical protein SBOR_5255 [Sclerotinia borealis F-4128]